VSSFRQELKLDTRAVHLGGDLLDRVEETSTVSSTASTVSIWVDRDRVYPDRPGPWMDPDRVHLGGDLLDRVEETSTVSIVSI
jgi:hypothetical protein